MCVCEGCHCNNFKQKLLALDKSFKKFENNIKCLCYDIMVKFVLLQKSFVGIF